VTEAAQREERSLGGIWLFVVVWPEFLDSIR